MSYKVHSPTVYLVRWDDGVAKAGFSAHQRWRAFVHRGARLLRLWTFDNTIAGVHDAFRLETSIDRLGHEAAFTDRMQAVPYLGGGGAGWSECFRCTEHCVEHCSGHCTDEALLHSAEEMLDAMQRRGEERRGLRGEGGYPTEDMTLSLRAHELEAR